jgi:hypothetical protein
VVLLIRTPSLFFLFESYSSRVVMNDNLDYLVHRKGQLCNDHVDLTNWVCMFTDNVGVCVLGP